MSLNTLLNQDIVIYNKSGLNSYGRETFGSGTTVKARFQQTSKTKFIAMGQVMVIDAIVYVLPSTIVNIDDKVTYEGNTYKVYGKYIAIDGGGVTNNIKLELTKWV